MKFTGGRGGFNLTKKPHHPDDQTVASVTAVPSKSTVEPGEQFTVTMTAKNAAGAALSGKTFTLVSSNSNVVSVNSVVGNVASCTALPVTPPPNGSTYTLTASSSAVNSPPTTITLAVILSKIVLAPSSLSLQAGNATSLTIVGQNKFGAIVPVPSPSALTTASAVASVGAIANSAMPVTAVSPGSATVSVKAGTVVSNAVPVSVAQVPATLVATSYRVTPASTSPAANATDVLTAQLLDQNGNPFKLAGRTITWSRGAGSGTGGTFSSTTGTTDANGVATMTFTVGAGESYTIVATDFAGCTGKSVPIVAGAAPGVPTSYLVTAATTTPAANATDGITAQLLDQNGRALAVAGRVVTFTRGPGSGSGGSFSSSTGTTNASGVATMTFTVGSNESYTIVATDGSGITGTSQTIVAAGAGGGNNNLAEPVYDPAVDTMIYQTGFEEYTNAILNPSPGAAVNPGSGPGFFLNKTFVYGPPNPTGPGSQTNTTTIVVPGNGGGKAVQFQYVGDGGNSESPGIIYYGNAGNGQNATDNNTTSVVEYWAKITSLGAPIDTTTRVRIKWLMLWHFDPTDSRIQFNLDTGQGGCGFNNWTEASAKWEVYEGGTFTGCNALQPVGPYFPAVANGQFHRFKHLVKPNSAPGARDARSLMWIDGVLMIRVEQTAVGVSPPGAHLAGDSTPQPWCIQADVDAMIVSAGIGAPEFGGPLTDGVTPFTVAIDDFKWYRIP